jgi:hypothetical protein
MSEQRYLYAMNVRAKNDAWRDPPCGGCEDRDEQIAELRAILAPLLDRNGAADVGSGYAEATCQFCGTWVERHLPDCPALEANKNRLLGRA